MRSKPKLLFLIAVFFISSLCLFIYFLPFFIEFLLSLYIKNTGIENFKIKVEKITSRELSLSSIKLGKGEEVGVSNAKIYYSFQGILDGRINSVDIDGLSLYLKFEDGKLSANILQSLAKKDTKNGNNLPMVLPFNKIVIRNSRINLYTAKEKITATLDGVINTLDHNMIKSAFNINLNGKYGDGAGKILLDWSFEKSTGNFEFAADGGFNMPDIIKIPQGSIDFKSGISFQNKILDLNVEEATVRVNKPIEQNKYNFTAQPFFLSLKKNEPARIKIDFNGKDKQSFSYDMQIEPTLVKANIKDITLIDDPLLINLKDAHFSGNQNRFNSEMNAIIKSNKINGALKAHIQGLPDRLTGNLNVKADGEIKLPNSSNRSHGFINANANISFREKLLELHINEAKAGFYKPIKGDIQIEPFELALKKKQTAKLLIDFSKKEKRDFSYYLPLEPASIKLKVKDRKKNIIPLFVNLRKARFEGNSKSLSYDVKVAISEKKADISFGIESVGSINNPGKENRFNSNIASIFQNKDGKIEAKANVKGSPFNFIGNIDLNARGKIDLPDSVYLPHGIINIKSDFSFQDRKLDAKITTAEMISDKSVEDRKSKRALEPFQINLNTTVSNQVHIDFSKENRSVSIFKLQFEPTEINMLANENTLVKLNLNNTSFLGKLNFIKEGPVEYKIITLVDNSELSLPYLNINLEDISLKTEINSTGSDKNIRLGFSDIILKQIKKDPFIVPLLFSGQVNYINGLSELKGRVKSINEKFVIDLKGAYETKDNTGEISFNLLPLSFSEGALEIGDIFPIAGKAINDVSGELKLKGKILFSEKKIKPYVKVHIKDFSFNVDNKKIIGINSSLSINGLFPLSTPPDQTISIKKLDAGLPFKNGYINFHINSDKLFFNKIKWDWGDGLLQTDPLQIKINDPKIKNILLHISGIQLNDLLVLSSQKGLSGTGILNGKIPVKFLDSGLFSITNGFLEASPEGGVIQYRPETPPQFLSGGNKNIQILAKALDNFHYKKLKLTLNDDPQKGVSGFLSLYGSNPELYNGKAIELNVKLTGDLIQVIQGVIGIYNIPGQIQNRLLH